MALDLQPVVDRLADALPELAAVYVFGSEAAGRVRAGSDIDVALYAGSPVDRGRLTELAEEIAPRLRRDVDLVDLAEAPTVLAMEVLRAGPPVAAPRPVEAALMELRVMRDYFDLKHRRSGVERDIAGRGRIHA